MTATKTPAQGPVHPWACWMQEDLMLWTILLAFVIVVVLLAIARRV